MRAICLFWGCADDSNHREYSVRMVCNPLKPTVCFWGRNKERETICGETSTKPKSRRMMTITSGKQVVATNNDDVYDVYKQGINFLTRSCSRARRIKCLFRFNSTLSRFYYSYRQHLSILLEMKLELFTRARDILKVRYWLMELSMKLSFIIFKYF